MTCFDCLKSALSSWHLSSEFFSLSFSTLIFSTHLANSAELLLTFSQDSVLVDLDDSAQDKLVISWKKLARSEKQWTKWMLLGYEYVNKWKKNIKGHNRRFCLKNGHDREGWRGIRRNQNVLGGIGRDREGSGGIRKESGGIRRDQVMLSGYRAKFLIEKRTCSGGIGRDWEGSGGISHCSFFEQNSHACILLEKRTLSGGIGRDWKGSGGDQEESGGVRRGQEGFRRDRQG